MLKTARLESMDILRGIALIFIIFFHSSIYNFANIHKIDFTNPPILIVLMSFMALWGGIFIICSTVVNTVMTLRRTGTGDTSRVFNFLILTGLAYLIWHYILVIILGRWNVDFVNNRPDLTIIAATIRNGQLYLPHISKYFEGSSLSTIAWNLIITATVLKLLLKDYTRQKGTRSFIILGATGTLIMLLSFVRVPLFGFVSRALESNNYLLSVFFSFTMANPYPLLPYLAYGLFGAMIAMAISFNRTGVLKRFIIPLGLAFCIYGITGMMNFTKTISKPDYFWYFKTNFELGIFLIAACLLILLVDHKPAIRGIWLPVKYFSRISLTIYMLETLVSEIVRIAMFQINPLWNQTINGSLLFGALMVVIWTGIVISWQKAGFKYSLEYWGVLILAKLGKQSTKMTDI